MSALEGKAASGGVSLVTTTITDEQVAEWPNELTIPELVGAKYFIIQGNLFLLILSCRHHRNVLQIKHP